MPPSLAHLRQTLREIERQDESDRPVLPFGIDAMDSRLAPGGLRVDALHEVAAAQAGWGDDAAAILFLAGIAARGGGMVLWILRRHDLFAPALYQAGLPPERLIHAEARDDAEVLAVMEDALRNRDLGAVVGEVRRAGMTATRRLQLAAEGGSTLALLLRHHAKAGEDPLGHPSAAATRWRIGSLPSLPLPVAGIGQARWHVAMVRQRGGAPFEFEMETPDETGSGLVAAGLVDRPDLAHRADLHHAA